ncbi:MAG: hypothetical protein A4E32_01252 [Methanomassiliicoccales archaeon PtaU1.Bin124]|nr:MAG: hypothetical protein A4E32_01252 [Methanomassiliicoccales archaeon PtaU1.Bin124]
MVNLHIFIHPVKEYFHSARFLRYLLLICFVLIIGANWFSSGILFGTDTTAPLNGGNYIDRMLNIWDYVVGYQDVRHLILWTYTLMCYPLFQVGMLFTNDPASALAFLEFCQFILVALAATLGISKLMEYLLEKKNININQSSIQTIITIAAIGYLFSIWAMNFIWRAYWPYVFHLGFLPIFLYLGTRYILKDGNQYKIFLGFLLIIPFLLPSYSVPVSLVFDIILLWAIAISFKPSLKKMFIRTIALGIPIVLLMAPFILPSIIANSSEVVVGRIISIASIDRLLEMNSPALIQSMAATGYPPFYNYSEMGWYLQMPFFIESLYILLFILLLFIPFMRKTVRSDRTIVALLAFYFLFVILMTSINTPYPIGNGISALYQIDLMKLLRSTFVRFAEYVMIAAILIIVLGWSQIVQNPPNIELKSRLFKKKVKIFSKYTFVLAVVACAVILVMPQTLSAASKNVFADVDPSDKTAAVLSNIPSSYREYFRLMDESSASSNSDIIIFSTPNNLNYMSWVSGPSLYYYGDWGRLIDISTEYETYSLILSELATSNDTNLYSDASFAVINDAVVLTSINSYFSKISDNIKTLLLSRGASIIEGDTSDSDILYYVISSDSSLKFYTTQDFRSEKIINQTILGITDGKNLLAYNSSNYLKTMEINPNQLPSLQSSNTMVVDNIDLLSNNRSQKIFLPMIVDVKEIMSDRSVSFFYYKIEPTRNSTIVEMGIGVDWVYHPLATYEEPAISSIGETTVEFTYSNSSATYRIDLGHGVHNVTIPASEYSLFLEMMKTYASDSFHEGNALIHIKSDRIAINEGQILDWAVGFQRYAMNPVDVYLTESQKLTKDPGLNYVRNSATEWTATLSLTEPEYLIFNEDYDPQWTALIYKDGAQVAKVSSMCYGGASNGFLIDTTGNITVKIVYDSQGIVLVGYLTAAISFIILVILCAIGYKFGGLRPAFNRVFRKGGAG